MGGWGSYHGRRGLHTKRVDSFGRLVLQEKDTFVSSHGHDGPDSRMVLPVVLVGALAFAGTPAGMALAGGLSTFAFVSVYAVSNGLCRSRDRRTENPDDLDAARPLLGEDAEDENVRAPSDDEFALLAGNFTANNVMYYERSSVCLASASSGTFRRDFILRRRPPSKVSTRVWVRSADPYPHATTAHDPILSVSRISERCTLPLSTSSSCRDGVREIVVAFNGHRGFAAVERSAFRSFRGRHVDAILVVRSTFAEGSIRDIIHGVKNVFRDESMRWNAENARPLDERDVRVYGRAVLSSLAELRAYGLIHDRLSASNVCVDAQGHAVLTDIEHVLLASPLDRDTRSFLARVPLDVPVDLALFGAFIYEMATGDVLRSDDVDFTGAPEPSDDLVNLMRTIFPPRTRKRARRSGADMTPARLLQHPFFVGEQRRMQRNREVAFTPELDVRKRSKSANRILERWRSYANAFSSVRRANGHRLR